MAVQSLCALILLQTQDINRYQYSGVHYYDNKCNDVTIGSQMGNGNDL